MSLLFKQPVDIVSHRVLIAQQNSLEWTRLTLGILMTETMAHTAQNPPMCLL